jgi:hypothetical protein
MIYVDNIEESYPVKFGKLLELVIVDILNSGFKRTKNPGAPYYFSENHLRKHFSIFIENTKDANLFPKLVIERKIIGDFKSSNREHGGTDYFYVNSLSENYNSSDVLATYEVKGPTRPILFKGSKVNWYPKIIEDIKKQAWRNLNFPNKENYIVLIINSPKNIDTHNDIKNLYKVMEDDVGNVKLSEYYWGTIPYLSSVLNIVVVGIEVLN